MSLNQQGARCARCKAYLFDEDDIVYCPECGAPHHRECYNSIGHCALEELHGTKDEYSREKELENQPIEAKEENTSTEDNTESEGFFASQGFAGFDFLGGVPKDLKLDEEVTAEEAKNFVIVNTHRYIPKFAILHKKNKISWNWGAFLFPCGWMFSRKMYKNGIFTGLLLIASSLLSMPLEKFIQNNYLDEVESYTQYVQNIYEALPNIGIAIIIFAFIGLLLGLGIRIFAALFGDYIYKKFTLSSIKKIKETSDDIEYDFRRKGGSNIFLLLIAELALDFICQTIFNFF